MANWGSVTITMKGLALQAKTLQGKELQFTKMVLGAGRPSDLSTATSLAAAKMVLDIASKTRKNNSVTIYATGTNAALTEEFSASECGLFATDPDEGEILYAIAIDTNPDVVPGNSSVTILSQRIGMAIAVDAATNVTTIVSTDGFITAADAENIANDKVNDHDTATSAHAAGIAGNAGSATKLKTARKITLTGKAKGTTTFDGSGDVTINVDSVTADKATADKNGKDLTTYVSDVTGTNDTLTVTTGADVKSTVKVDNVAHAGTADSLAYTMIPNGADLNDYYKVGEYVFVGDANLGTLSNTPADLKESFKLSVTKDVYFQQRLVTYNTHRVFCRRENMGWIEQPAGTAQTAANNVLKTGDTMSGDLTIASNDYGGVNIKNSSGTKFKIRCLPKNNSSIGNVAFFDSTGNQLYSQFFQQKNGTVALLDDVNTKADKSGGNATGTWTISITGNATTATTAAFGKSLSIVSGNEIKFDSSGYTNGGIVNIGWCDVQKSTKRVNKWVFKNLGGEDADVQAKAFYSSNGGFYGNVHGNADTATKLSSARTISLTGAVTGSARTDLSGTVSIATNIAGVAVLTGTINDGGTLPIPSGYTESQCKFFVSPNNLNSERYFFDVAEDGRNNCIAAECYVSSRVVHVAMIIRGMQGDLAPYSGTGSVGNLAANYTSDVRLPSSANYMVIGIK
ncbi:pyocin knob domain-containing protein [uncultured Megasphaera sp.]|uniref:pyocin knob domain-containing protein n=1 Tax=uncultured Megasphaera sp. TaxID=165188 RepID=UPI002598AA83|nr:pyocin knob domain-containing protein [uncultured Megasphaera sp.]